MFYAKLKQNGKIIGNLYYNHRDYQQDTFDPEIETIKIIPFKVKGENYRQRQNNLQETAIDFQFIDCDCDINLSMDELCEIGEWFEKMGRRYGLLQEFRENAIC